MLPEKTAARCHVEPLAELAEERGALLPLMARQAVEEALGVGRFEHRDDAWLFAHRASFVTLTTADGELRGCVGSVRAVRSLVEDLRRNAVAAAFADPRFPHLTAGELARTPFAVSVLSPLTLVSAASEVDLLDRLEPGVDGLVLEHGTRCGIFLPQVWWQLPEPSAFVRHLKRKAGLPADFWSSDLAVWRFTSRTWREEARSPRPVGHAGTFP